MIPWLIVIAMVLVSLAVMHFVKGKKQERKALTVLFVAVIVVSCAAIFLEGSELRLYHKLLRYAGTADLVCRIGDELWIIDYKSTGVLSEMLVRVQLEAYAKALESFGVKVHRKGALHLKKDGSWAFPGFDAGDGAAWRVFGGLKTIHDYVRSYDK